MEPIINPLWFYLIDIVTSLKIVFMVTGILIVMGLGVISISQASWSMKDLHNFWKCKITRIFAVAAPILIIIGCFIPCAETTYKMLIASLITPDNIEATGGAVQDIVDYIINSVNELLNQ